MSSRPRAAVGVVSILSTICSTGAISAAGRRSWRVGPTASATSRSESRRGTHGDRDPPDDVSRPAMPRAVVGRPVETRRPGQSANFERASFGAKTRSNGRPSMRCGEANVEKANRRRKSAHTAVSSLAAISSGVGAPNTATGFVSSRKSASRNSPPRKSGSGESVERPAMVSPGEPRPPGPPETRKGPADPEAAPGSPLWPNPRLG